MRRAWRALRSCISSPADLWLLARIAAWALVLPVLKRLVPLRTLVALMAAESRRSERDADLERRITRMARLVYRGRRATFRDNCLERSLVTYRYLARAGAQPRLLVGVGRSETASVRGHAWVTLDGRAVHDQEEELAEHAELTAFGPDGHRVSAGRAGSPPRPEGRPEAGSEPKRSPGIGRG